MDEAPCEAEALSKEAERLQQEVETLKAQVKEQPDSKALQGHLKALWPGSDVEMGFQMPISDPMGVAGSERLVPGMDESDGYQPPGDKLWTTPAGNRLLDGLKGREARLVSRLISDSQSWRVRACINQLDPEMKAVAEDFVRVNHQGVINGTWTLQPPPREALLPQEERKARGKRDGCKRCGCLKWTGRPQHPHKLRAGYLKPSDAHALRTCGGCDLHPLYCSPECQRLDWIMDGGHKGVCTVRRRSLRRFAELLSLYPGTLAEFKLFLNLEF